MARDFPLEVIEIWLLNYYLVNRRRWCRTAQSQVGKGVAGDGAPTKAAKPVDGSGLRGHGHSARETEGCLPSDNPPLNLSNQIMAEGNHGTATEKFRNPSKLTEPGVGDWMARREIRPEGE